MITQEKYAKLLGITFDDVQKWQTQISGKGGVLSALNQRLFLIKRLQNSLNIAGLRKLAERKGRRDYRMTLKWTIS